MLAFRISVDSKIIYFFSDQKQVKIVVTGISLYLLLMEIELRVNDSKARAADD